MNDIKVAAFRFFHLQENSMEDKGKGEKKGELEATIFKMKNGKPNIYCGSLLLNIQPRGCVSFYFTDLIRNTELPLVHGVTSLPCILLLKVVGLLMCVDFNLEVENKTCHNSLICVSVLTYEWELIYHYHRNF